MCSEVLQFNYVKYMTLKHQLLLNININSVYGCKGKNISQLTPLWSAISNEMRQIYVKKEHHFFFALGRIGISNKLHTTGSTQRVPKILSNYNLNVRTCCSHVNELYFMLNDVFYTSECYRQTSCTCPVENFILL